MEEVLLRGSAATVEGRGESTGPGRCEVWQPGRAWADPMAWLNVRRIDMTSSD